MNASVMEPVMTQVSNTGSTVFVLVLLALVIFESLFTLYGLYKEVVWSRDNRVLWVLLLLFVPASGLLWYLLRFRD